MKNSTLQGFEVRTARSKTFTRLGASLLDDGSRADYRNVVFLKNISTMDKVKKRWGGGKFASVIWRMFTARFDQCL